jgi:uncharacterized protein CbrC (UPF0167 family)
MLVTRPHRVSHTYRQRLVAPPSEVFPLLCPVRETEWVDGWSPGVVLTESGVAERDCVFTTAAGPSEAIWYITRHEPDQLFVEMLKITPGMTAVRLQIQLHEAEDGCAADVTYAFTSLGPKGDELVGAFTYDRYREFMVEWETQLNHFLTAGQTGST